MGIRSAGGTWRNARSAGKADQPGIRSRARAEGFGFGWTLAAAIQTRRFGCCGEWTVPPACRGTVLGIALGAGLDRRVRGAGRFAALRVVSHIRLAIDRDPQRAARCARGLGTASGRRGRFRWRQAARTLARQGRRGQYRSRVGESRRACRRIDHRRLARANFDFGHFAANRYASLDNRNPQSLARAGRTHRVADGLFGRVQGAANADGGGRRAQPVVVAMALADRTGRGADRASQQAVEPALAGCIELIFVDPELCARLHRNDRSVAEAKLGAALASGRHEIADPDVLANGQGGPRTRAAEFAQQLDFASDHDRAGVLGQDLCGDLEHEQRQCRPGQLTRGAGPFRRQQLASRSGALPRPAGRGGHFQNR